MDLSQVSAFWIVSVMFISIPGSDWAYIISASIRQQRFIIPAIAGLLGGHLIAILIVAAGIGTLIMKIPDTLKVITVLGAFYLIWLGIMIIRNPSVPVADEDSVRGLKSTLSQWFFKGLGISFLNPKLYLFFFALLPQFTSNLASWSVTIQILVLGFLHLLSCFLIYLFVGLFSGMILKTRPRVAKLVSQASGVFMIILAIYLLIGQI